MICKCVIIPIHTKWLDLIVEKYKTIELRKVGLRPDTERILFYEVGTKLITATCMIENRRWIMLDTLIRDPIVISDTQVTNQELIKYANGKDRLYCIFLWRSRCLKTPITLADVGLTRAPQSYVYRDMDINRLAGAPK